MGGLPHDAAVARVRDTVEAPLHRPIQVEADDFQAQTTPWELGLGSTSPPPSPRPWSTPRTATCWSGCGGGSPATARPRSRPRPTWGEGQMNPLLDTAAKEVDFEAKSASHRHLQRLREHHPATTGRALDIGRLPPGHARRRRRQPGRGHPPRPAPSSPRRATTPTPRSSWSARARTSSTSTRTAPSPSRGRWPPAPPTTPRRPGVWRITSEDREPYVAQPRQRLGQEHAQDHPARAQQPPRHQGPRPQRRRPSSSTPRPTSGRSATARPTAASA